LGRSNLSQAFQAVKGVKRVTPYITWDENFGSYDPDYPAANLKIEPLAYVCRSSDLAATSTRYKGTFDRQRYVRLVGICRHNVSIDALVRVRLYEFGEATVSVDPSTDTVTCTSHGLTTGNTVTFWNSGGSIPSGIAYGTVYYARSVTTDTFTIHTTSIGAGNNTDKVNITSAGSGNTYVLRKVLYDSDWIDFWPAVYGDDILEWEDDNWWTAKYLEEEIVGYKPTRPFFFNQAYFAKTITVEIDDSSSSSSFVDIGMIELSRGWQFAVNFSQGAQFGFRFRTREVESESGIKEFERRDKPRRFVGKIDYASRDETMENAFEDFRQNDIDTVFLWFPHPNNPKHWLRDTILARNVDPGLFEYTALLDEFSIPISLEEVL
jgi:hypothetical protein